jgi:VanZ family protein
MGIIFYLSAQPDLPHPDSGWVDLAVSSAAHIFLFAVLAALMARAWGNRTRALWLVGILAMAYALLDELHQAFVPGRHPDFLDLVCDGLGVLLGLLVYRALIRRQTVRQG